ncbi:phosphatidate cytidylyltransferase [Shimia sagamensis]|uniref:Phosphatidate cytidylyltransferase n=1 Tax=Shimia sagamensis TaxID=1566352 RepID=A0ABY1N8Q6_9RHOB|nr:phosphatidate cytidylyltransferase [Shimia sagamensis]SMP03484.1 Cytidylyltransferase family protein [Shimia sagamensis]
MTDLTLAQVAAAIAAIYAFGFGIIGVLAMMPARRKDAVEFCKILGTATALIAVMTALFLFGEKALLIALPIITARVSFEVSQVRTGERSTSFAFGLSSGMLALMSMLVSIAPVAILGLWLLCFARLIMIPKRPDSRNMQVLDMLVYPVLPACLLASGTIEPGLAALLLAAYLMVEIFDSFALFFGAMWGRTKAFPTLSPNKTFEGLLGGAASLAALSLITAAFLSLPLLLTAFTALLVGTLAVVGDLAASRHKRIAGVKDYPQVLPRQGGLLDSLDSWIAAGAGLTALHIFAQLW